MKQSFKHETWIYNRQRFPRVEKNFATFCFCQNVIYKIFYKILSYSEFRGGLNNHLN